MGKNRVLEWTDEFEVAFKQLKEYLGSPPLLTVLTTGEKLIVYFICLANNNKCSAYLRRGQIHKLVYYVSKVLMGDETRYLKVEKLAYALFIIARKLFIIISKHTPLCY